MSDWERLPGIGEQTKGCLTCGPLAAVLKMDAWIVVGFGESGYSVDGVTVVLDEDGPLAARDIELRASADPDHDWRIFFMAPLYDASYQRHGPERWVLVEKGEGFV